VSRGIRAAGVLAALLVLAGCGAIMVQPKAELPPPLIDRLPETVGIYFPAEFRDFNHKERRSQVDYEIQLGPAHVARLTRLLQAMFARVVEVSDPAAALSVDPDIRLVLEPRFEDYAFLTPQDMAGDYYTVTIRYRFDLYDPQGQRVDGYVFTGYGRQKSAAMSNTEPLVRATERAMRDAGAKLAIELTEQETVRRLLAGEKVVPRENQEQEVQQALGSFDVGQPVTAPAAAPDAAAPPPEVSPEPGAAAQAQGEDEAAASPDEAATQSVPLVKPEAAP
jgi:hypothetical protein